MAQRTIYRGLYRGLAIDSGKVQLKTTDVTRTRCGQIPDSGAYLEEDNGGQNNNEASHGRGGKKPPGVTLTHNLHEDVATKSPPSATIMDFAGSTESSFEQRSMGLTRT